jgi:hypothetical protein
VTGGWRKLHTEQLRKLYSPNVDSMIRLRRVRWAGHVACLWEMRVAYKILVGKREGKS